MFLSREYCFIDATARPWRPQDVTEENRTMDLTPGQMHQKVYLPGENTPEELPGGVIRRLLARIGNVSLYLNDAMPRMRLDMAASDDEVVLFFLDGCARTGDKRIVREDEAIIEPPQTASTLHFMGVEGIRYLEVRVTPLAGAAPVDPADAAGTIRLHSLPAVQRPITGSIARYLLRSQSAGVAIVDAIPGVDVDGDTAHPENEIVYVLEGKIEFLDGQGRVVRPGECVTNVPGMEHPNRYSGRSPIRMLEINSPPFGQPVPSAAG